LDNQEDGLSPVRWDQSDQSCAKGSAIMANPVTSIEHLPTAVVIHVLAKQLGSHETDVLSSDIAEARVNTPTLPFIVDMANVNYAGSMTLGALIGLNREFRKAGQRLIFVGVTGNIHHMFTASYVIKLVELMTDVPAALLSLGASERPA
jgi:anti-anti-sigma factor